MRAFRRLALALVLPLYACGPANTPETKSAGGATSSCSATNDAGKDCKISCTAPQAAVCTRGTGGGEPTCVCR